MRLDRCIHVAHFQVTLDVVPAHSLAHKLNGFKAHLVNGGYSLLPDLVSKLQRGGNAGKASADNTNVDCLITGQLRVVGGDIFCCRIVRVGMG